MSYSASDFVNDCAFNAEDYDLPPLMEDQLEALDLDSDPERWNESDQLRALAERVAGAMSDRKILRELLREAFDHVDGDEGGAVNLRQRIREALGMAP